MPGLRRHGHQPGDALRRRVGGLRGAHVGVDAAHHRRRATRPELLLGRLQHLPRAVLVGRARLNVRQVADLLGQGRQRRPAALPGALGPPLALLLALHPRADESR
jgi:hypothetical protein